ncbi:hypothetical protein RclHR1_28270001 [Rhizophagus clarus]|uniref:Uncharacterized protein n=1 Tax=Rhizophagus clarus TaxID=94130 RepID=A0A2Z6R3R7_9GLOM|nr:hypothetical protein RclHR1_28270001 [Rhizophagus clarus]
MANSFTPFIQRLFIYRLMLIQFRFLIPISPLMVDDWSLWSNMNIFKHDYIACTLASMVSTPSTCNMLTSLQYLQILLYLAIPLCIRTAYIAHLADKCDHSLPHKWYLDIKTNTTIPDSHDHLYDRYVCSPSVTPSITLAPGATTTQKYRHWLITLDDNDAPLFGKQLSVQPKKDTCVIVYWISDCLSSPGDIIHLHPCPDCDAHVSFPTANKYSAVPLRCTFKISLLKSLILSTNCERIRQNTTEVTSPYSWADLGDTIILYYRRFNISPDFSPISSMVDDALSDRSLPKVPLRLPLLLFLPQIYNTIFIPMSTNFELWASIERSIHVKRLTILPVKAKGHDGNYWNEFANSLANFAHHSDTATPLPATDYTSSHNICLVYDDIVCESNPRHFLKAYYQAFFMKDLLALKRFQFTFCLCNRNDYVIDWHYTFKFKLFLDDLPLLERLKIIRLDLYIDLLTCRSCRIHKKDLIYLILCAKRFTTMHQILQAYQNHLFFKLRKASDLADMDLTPMLWKLSSLSCWTIFSSNWSS